MFQKFLHQVNFKDMDAVVILWWLLLLLFHSYYYAQIVYQ